MGDNRSAIYCISEQHLNLVKIRMQISMKSASITFLIAACLNGCQSHLTGTPLDLTPFGAVLQGIGVLYWLFVISLVVLVIVKVKGRIAKTLLVVVVLGVMVAPVAWHLAIKNAQQLQRKARLDAAMALFKMRCKTAGEKIANTVENVDGVVWMKWRPKEINLRDQFKLDDPYGKDCSMEGCILLLLHHPSEQSRGNHLSGYLFVETVDPRDGVRYRYSGVSKKITPSTQSEFSRHVESTGYGAEFDGTFFALKREPIEQFSARYGITWDDISTQEDRAKWIAGGALKVIDLHTNKVIAERKGYMIDMGQGASDGGRQPWTFAQDAVCPLHYVGSPVSYSEKTWPFISKIIKLID